MSKNRNKGRIIVKYPQGTIFVYIPQEEDKRSYGMTAVKSNAKRYNNSDAALDDIKIYAEKLNLHAGTFEVEEIEAPAEEALKEKAILTDQLRNQLLCPVESLWLERGRVIVKVTKRELFTPGGIRVEEPVDNTIKTGVVMSRSESLMGKVDPGDNVLFTQLGGNVLQLAYHRTVNIKEPAYSLFAQDIIGKWNMDPDQYYELIEDYPEFSI